ncbi:MAG: hypothetical protein C4576_12665, partial [Desulfobacteraceae bacterium]
MPEKQYGVFLTNAGLAALRGNKILKWFFEENDFLICHSVDTNGNYLHMTVDLTLSDVHEMELSIPHHYVLGITLGHQDKILGFHN